MYYILYLSSLCRRRRWPDPLYDIIAYGSGYACSVRVNHRDYQAETTYETEELAREAAAMHAYLICRNLSILEGLTANGGDLSTSSRRSSGVTSEGTARGTNPTQYQPHAMLRAQAGVSVGSGGGWSSRGG